MGRGLHGVIQSKCINYLREGGKMLFAVTNKFLLVQRNCIDVQQKLEAKICYVPNIVFVIFLIGG